MQKYINSVADKNGKPVSGASVLVQNYPSLTTAKIYSDNNSTALSNPITTDSNGAFAFYAADGRYALQITGATITPQTVSDILLEDPTDGGAAGSFSSLTVAGAATVGGSSVQTAATLAASTASAAIGTTAGNVQSDINARPTSTTLAATTGAASVGSDDGASGSLWTTVAGFIAKIISSAGASVVGFIQAGTGAVSRFVQDKLRERVSAKDYGAVGNGVADDSSKIASAATAIGANGFVEITPGTYRISTNTTISSGLLFNGGTITVDAGITLTINGPVIGPNLPIFSGAGNVAISGPINFSWFTGATAQAKWDMMRRGFTGNVQKAVHFYAPHPSDPAYVYVNTGNGLYGPAWKVTGPLTIDTAENVETWYMEGAHWYVTGAIDCIFKVGPTVKSDVVTIVGSVKAIGDLSGTVDPTGASAQGQDVFKFYGGGHWYIDRVETWEAGAALRFAPTGSLQNNEIKVGSVYGARHTAPLVYMEGASGARSITEIDIGPVTSDGTYATTPANSVVYMKGCVQNVSVGAVTLRAVNAGYSDVSTAVVLLENNATNAPSERITIAAIANGVGSSKLFQCRDTTSGAGPKFGYVTVRDMDNETGNASIDWCTNFRIGKFNNGTLTIGSNASFTFLQDVPLDRVSDSGTWTLYNGVFRKKVSLATDTAVSYTIPSAISDLYLVRVGSIITATSGIAVCRSYAVLHGEVVSGGTNFAATTGALAGTTGVASKVTVSAAAGLFYLENRGGSTQTFVVEITPFN